MDAIYIIPFLALVSLAVLVGWFVKRAASDSSVKDNIAPTKLWELSRLKMKALSRSLDLPKREDKTIFRKIHKRIDRAQAWGLLEIFPALYEEVESLSTGVRNRPEWASMIKDVRKRTEKGVEIIDFQFKGRYALRQYSIRVINKDLYNTEMDKVLELYDESKKKILSIWLLREGSSEEVIVRGYIEGEWVCDFIDLQEDSPEKQLRWTRAFIVTKMEDLKRDFEI